MKSLWHWLTELGEVYARHADHHGPHQLLPTEVLPPHGRMSGHRDSSPQVSDPGGGTTEHSAPKACTRCEPM
jgi:hypothetical protein